MKTFIGLVFSFLFVSSIAMARITDGKDHLKLSGHKVVVTLDKGFHFVMESPAGLYIDGELGSFPPTKKTENQMVFDVSKLKERPFSISFFVCDDQKTVCESHEAHLQVKKGKLVKVETPVEVPAAPAESPAAASETK